jgi:hypothetical protein
LTGVLSSEGSLWWKAHGHCGCALGDFNCRLFLLDSGDCGGIVFNALVHA